MNKLLKTLSKIISLLEECGWEKKAAWFLNIQKEINGLNPNSKTFQNLLIALEDSLTGMGSFNDLPLKSKVGNKNEEELKNQQWNLVEELGDIIEELKS